MHAVKIQDQSQRILPKARTNAKNTAASAFGLVCFRVGNFRCLRSNVEQQLNDSPKKTLRAWEKSLLWHS